MTRILIIDDDIPLSNQLMELFLGEGFIVEQCHDGQQGLLTALKGTFDLVLLKVLLPTLNGFSILDQLRQSRQTPVMMLTNCDGEEERIKGYQKGADDYLSQPFNSTELIARVNAILRRCRKNNHENPSSFTTLMIDELSLDRSIQQVTFAGTEIVLTSIQFRLLWVLVESQHAVLTKRHLYQTVLEREFSRYDRSLDMHLSRIRRKLIEAGMMPERFVTVHGKGYCFV